MLLSKLFGENFLRKKIFNKTSSESMRNFLSKPFPEKNELIAKIDIVSVDFETTGLDILKDSVVSIGVVNIEEMSINLGSSYHQLVRPDTELTEKSVTIHHITNSQLEGARAVDVALAELLHRLSGKVMLAHNARLEVGFLNSLCKRLYDAKFVIPVIDTLHLAKRSFERQNKPYRDSDLRLYNLREMYNMPAYKAHNAQMDAIATAELFLAIAGELSPKNQLRLRDCLS